MEACADERREKEQKGEERGGQMWGRCNATIMVMDEGEEAGGWLRP